ncbi:MAG: Crp/Fnr family transcriptional regulator [Actinomycetota bacterium]
MRPERLAAILGKTEIFEGLDAQALGSLAESSGLRSYGKGDLILRQGELADVLLVLVEGLAKVVVTSEKGDEMLLTTLRPFQIFGELSFADGQPRSASVEALGPCTVTALERATLLELARQHPSITERLLRYLSAMVRRTTEQALDLVCLPLPSRIAKLLVSFAEVSGEGTEPEIVLDLPFNQSDIAQMVGGTRQSVNHALRSFEARGYLKLRGKKIVLLRLDRLRLRASG